MKKQSPDSPQFVAYVYPGWHNSKYRPEVDEWRFLQDFRPYFDGHLSLPRPLDGPYDDTRTETPERQIALAQQHDISVFTYFSYFQPGGFVMSEPVDQALAAAERSPGFQLSLTLCLRLPHRILPLPLSYSHWRFQDSRARPISSRLRSDDVTPSQTSTAALLELLDGNGHGMGLRGLRLVEERTRRAVENERIDANPAEQRRPALTIDSIIALFEQWARQYSENRSYWCIDGRPVCALLNLADFARTYGLDGFTVLLSLARGVFRKRLHVNPFLVGVVGEATLRNADLATRLPIDAVTGYGLLPEWSGPPVQQYPELIERRVKEWYFFQERVAPLPFLPVACCGWDATVRGAWAGDLRAVRGFPWRPIVTGVTPELFGEFVARAVRFNQTYHPQMNVVFLHAWNEWTESAAIEPSDRFGYHFLKAVRAAGWRSNRRYT